MRLSILSGDAIYHHQSTSPPPHGAPITHGLTLNLAKSEPARMTLTSRRLRLDLVVRRSKSKSETVRQSAMPDGQGKVGSFTSHTLSLLVTFEMIQKKKKKKKKKEKRKFSEGKPSP
jgi:hypothetical protein